MISCICNIIIEHNEGIVDGIGSFLDELYEILLVIFLHSFVCACLIWFFTNLKCSFFLSFRTFLGDMCMISCGK